MKDMPNHNAAEGRNFFPKSERLHHTKSVENLLTKGRSFFVFPIKLIYLPAHDSAHHHVLFSVSKKRFKRAVDRNLLKRRMREIYRCHKPPAPFYYLMIHYVSDKLLPFQAIQESVLKVLEKLSAQANVSR